jgi:hypothetical protein
MRELSLVQPVVSLWQVMIKEVNRQHIEIPSEQCLLRIHISHLKTAVKIRNM